MQTTCRALTRIRRFINKLPGWSMLTLPREDGYLYCDPTQTHTHSHRNTHPDTHLVQVPAALSSGLQTEHSILFNHMCVSRPAAGCLSRLACVCLSCVYVCVYVCVRWTGIWSLAGGLQLHLIPFVFLL